MTEQPLAEVEQQHWFFALLSWAGYLLEIASMFVQLIVVVLVITNPGGGLGLVMLIYASLFLVIPATLVAMGRAAAALGRFHARSSLASLAFHASAALLPLASYPAMFYERSPTPKAEAPPSAREQSLDPSRWLVTQGGSRTSGAEWAINNGILHNEDCEKLRAPRAFIEGCQAQARSQAGLPQR
ncbi:MAG TPA: hypothetical protein VEM38_00310 [Burkholderiales bacterium]|nr:hypothetical protein [Burkholderiales bacterium]